MQIRSGHMSQHADRIASSREEAHGDDSILHHKNVAAPYIRPFCGSPSVSNAQILMLGGV